MNYFHDSLDENTFTVLSRINCSIILSFKLKQTLIKRYGCLDFWVSKPLSIKFKVEVIWQFSYEKNIINEKRLDEIKVKCPIIPNVLIQGLKIINGFIILGIQLIKSIWIYFAWCWSIKAEFSQRMRTHNWCTSHLKWL